MISEVSVTDVSTLSGEDAAGLVEELTPLVRRLTSFRDACAARAIEANQHTVCGAGSAAEWLSSVSGISRRSALRSLSAQKSVAMLPSVESAVRSGVVSMEMASVIARGAEGSSVVAAELLEEVPRRSVEEMQRRVEGILSSKSDVEKRRRNSQYVDLRVEDGFVKGNLQLLASSASWFDAWKRAEHDAVVANQQVEHPLPVVVAVAEAFSSFLSKRGGGDAKTVVTYHLDVPLAGKGRPSAELVGVGPVPLSVIEEIRNDARVNVVLRAENKLAGYYENTKPDPDRPLPDFVKRAVKADAYDRCAKDGCVELAREVDHVVARANGGDHDLENLQALCKSHHHAKTKVDVPWTVARFYGKRRKKVNDDDRRSPEVRVDEPKPQRPVDIRSDELFPDTG
jgi:hypothetical protein